MTGRLSLVHLPLSLRALAEESDDRGWMQRRRRDGRLAEIGFDEGRALHHLLAETFGPGALQPYRLLTPPRGERASLYAYSQADPDELRRISEEIAPPQVSEILELERLRTKEMPSDWPAGRRIGFDLRFRPTVRLRTPLPNPRDAAKPYSAGAELDAFFVEAVRDHPDAAPSIARDGSSGMAVAERSRETVYRDWLAARLAPALAIESFRLARFARTRVRRAGTAIEGPDAIGHGTAVVQDGAVLAEKLAGGVGRHKAYGYGMLLLRAPDRPPPQR